MRGLIYPVPDPRYPFLGVHFTRRVGGAVDLGPNAVLGLAREGYRRRDFRPADVASQPWRGRVSGAWLVATGEPDSGSTTGPVSKEAFVAEARRLVPDVSAADVAPAPAGVRAQAVDAHGNLVDDFRIGWAGGRGQVMTVRNAPSPAATSALAIAEHLVDELCPAGE